MRHFRLNVALLLTAAIVLAVVATVLFAKGFWAPGILVTLCLIIPVAAIWHMQTRLIRTMAGFVSALEMNDSTMRITTGGDPELRRMSEAMNRISDLYRHNLIELETRKLYYDRILRIMTHEMRNSITPMASMTADMIANPEAYKGETLVEVAELMHGQVEGIRRFLDSYYTLTHLPEPKLTPVSASEYFHGVLRLAEAELRRRELPENSVSFIVPEEMIIDIDPALMNQVMINLLRNSFDAMIPGVAPHVEVVLTVSDGRPCLTVSDNGQGIPVDVLPNLFQPFFTTKEGGSGVGLSICRQIIRRHGGELQLRSRDGKGTTVVITL